ncbi:methylmalonyl-CoA mutase family protein, partial [Lutibacter sp.]
TLFHHPNEFGEQIAQNQLLILKEENNFKNAQHIVTDTYYIETITKEIAEKALAIFKDIEKGGGFLHQLKEGTIQRKIAENAQKEQIKFNSGELVLVGSNKYLNEQENIKNNIEISPFIKRKPYKTLIIPISAKRLSETLEQKRLKNET